MRRQHLCRLDGGEAGQGGVFLTLGGDPAGGRAIDRFGDVVALHEMGILRSGQERQDLPGTQAVARLFDPLDQDRVVPGRQAGVVGQPDLGEQHPVDLGHMATHVGDPRVETGAGVQHHLDEVRGEFDMDVLEVEQIAERAPASVVGRLPQPRLLRLVPLASQLVRQEQCQATEAAGPEHERQERQPGHQREERHQGRDGAQRGGMPPQLADEGEVRRPRRAAPRQEQGRGDGDDDGRDLADQAVADGEDRIGLERLPQRHVVDAHPDDQADDEVQRSDQEARNRIALHELGRAVERAEERGFGLFRLPPELGVGMGDGARSHVRVDRELLAGHGVKGEARAHLGHPGGALVDDHEVDDQQHAEHDEAEEDRPPHHEHRKALDHLAGGVGAGMAFGNDELRRRDVERQPQHQGGQQHGRKGRKVERPLDEERRGEDQDGQGEGCGEPDVEHQRWHRQHHHDDDGHERDGQQHRRVEQSSVRQARHQFALASGGSGRSMPLRTGRYSFVISSPITSRVLRSRRPYGSLVDDW